MTTSSSQLKSQEFINNIKEWTDKQKMILNSKKTKVMIFNFTEKYKFTTRLKLDNKIIEVVSQAKNLGVHITNDLKWDVNTEHLVKRANTRMELLRKVTSQQTQKKREIYTYYKSEAYWNSLVQCGIAV